MNPVRGANRAYVIACRALAIGCGLLFRLRAFGREHVPDTGPLIVASNHASFLDPPAIGVGVWNRQVRFMARDSLFRVPVLGWILRRVGVIPLRRESGDVAALRTGLRVLKDGGVLGVFPEGTRSRDGRMQRARGGVGFLILKSGVPVVPAYIDGAYRALPKGRLLVRPTRITVRFGEPIQPEEFTGFGRGQEAYEQVGALVMERIAALRGRAEG